MIRVEVGKEQIIQPLKGSPPRQKSLPALLGGGAEGMSFRPEYAVQKERRALDDFGAQAADIPVFFGDVDFDLGDEDEEEES